MTQWKDYPRRDTGAGSELTGAIKVLEKLRSPQLGNERDILVYLPPSYASGGDRRYPVIYMHDGQNLFDEATSFAGAWALDAAADEVSREGAEAIIVGIPNSGQRRFDEYSPFEDATHGGGGQGARYIDFIVQTIKPLVDAGFRTARGRQATGIAGSSLGGLISLYGFFRSGAFGFAGVMSPALWVAERSILDYAATAPFRPGRLYLDVGTSEGKRELEDVSRLCEMLVGKGYRPGEELLCVIERGGMHNEEAWSRRVREGLRFMLGVAGAEALSVPLESLEPLELQSKKKIQGEE